MFKRLMSLCLVLALVAGLLPAIALVSEPETVAAYQSTGNGTTNNVTYTIGAGTDAEVSVISDWRSTSMSPTQSLTPQYVMVHNTGTYVGTATAKNVHNNTNKTSTSACWHYTVDSTVIYQGLSDTRRGWHSATSYSYLPSNVNSIGIEMCVNNFPATETFGGELWTDGTAIMEWWENEFDQTMKHTAYLCLVLCERWGLDWQTDIVTHWDAWQYSVSGKSGKDCPMQMRATYDASTNEFTQAGTYADGRDGYFWQIFWSYVEQYAAGATSVGNGGTTATKLGTYQATPSEGLNVRSSTDTTDSSNIVGTLIQGEVFEVTELVGGNWAKIRMQDGTEGYASALNYADYIGVDAQAYTVGANSEGLTYSYDTDGGLKLTNTSSSQGQFDMYMPFDIGTQTTPYMSLQVTPVSGDGYYFGITQNGSGYWMMRDCNSGDQLVVEESAPYMVNQETLEINVQEWWKPEADYHINQVRFYLAPDSSIKINYFYFAAASGAVVDSRYNLMAKADNVTLLQPDTIAIGDYTKTGSYVYSNGMLTVTADTDAGFDVVFNVNETFEVATIKRLLVGIDAATSFNITLTLTNANGVGEVSLVNDFYPEFTSTFPTDGYIPGPFEGTRGLDLYNYFDYNGVIPADGLSTITQVKVSLGSAGTSYFNSIQIASNDRIISFRDGVYKEGFSDGTQPDPVLVGDVNQDGEITTADAREILLLAIDTSAITEELLALADYDGDGTVSTADARDLLLDIVG